MFNISTGAMAKTSTHLQQEKTNEVLVTKNYKQFKKVNGNRELNQLHLKRLTESVNENDLLFANPILVNERYEIIDGQHRFEVCQKLGKPVHYIKCKGLGLKEIQILNANSKNWKLLDYIEGYCDMGLSEYCYLKSEINRTNLGISILMALMANNGDNSNATNSLKNGTLKLPYKKRALTVSKWVADYEQYYEGSKRRSFVIALMTLHGLKGYNHKQMMKKLKYQSSKLVDCTSSKSYLALLEEIYNYKERGEKLRFF